MLRPFTQSCAITTTAIHVDALVASGFDSIKLLPLLNENDVEIIVKKLILGGINPFHAKLLRNELLQRQSGNGADSPLRTDDVRDGRGGHEVESTGLVRHPKQVVRGLR
jgi:hypothetical protein